MIFTAEDEAASVEAAARMLAMLPPDQIESGFRALAHDVATAFILAAPQATKAEFCAWYPPFASKVTARLSIIQSHKPGQG